MFGDDLLEPESLRNLLSESNLCERSNIKEWIGKQKNPAFNNRLRNALGYPIHMEVTREILKPNFTPKQSELLPNIPGSKRVLGVAGSGKTLLLVHKAINAALEGKKVLLVCFNITMANKLKDDVRNLAHHFGPHIHRNIEVRHYHSLLSNSQPDDEFPNSLDSGGNEITTYMKGPFDVLLIDEGQDFEREWIVKLQKLCSESHHFMFAEDDRQDIYQRVQKRKNRSVPDIVGRPHLLSKSHRLPTEIADLANSLFQWSKTSSESGSIEIERNLRLFAAHRPTWFNGSYEEAQVALVSDLKTLWDTGTLGAPSDTVILVAKVEDGWDLEDKLSKLPIPRIMTFETRSENKKLQLAFGKNSDAYRLTCQRLRRKYKVAFRMQTGRIKIATIHSFKGWELNRVFVLFRPDAHQYDANIQLLYTAMTRSRDLLAVYNASPSFKSFGEMAISSQLASPRLASPQNNGRFTA